MINATIYEQLTGKILEIITSENIDLLLLNIGNRSYIEGAWAAKDFYIENNTAVPKPLDPSTVTDKYNFDFQTKSWTINIDNTEKAVRDYRNFLLSFVDKVNPLWYSSLDLQSQQELQTYRQNLLNITDQQGFPTTIIWPQKPSWL